MKKKILWISDHPMVPSGVGTQSKYVIENLLATKEYKFICFGGAVKHPDYTPQKIMPDRYGDDWIVVPVDGYGSDKTMREVLMHERPDAVVIFTDPRFFVWLWSMEDEIRRVCPIIYWHVWDNDPPPKFNKVFYDSTDSIVSLSLKTHGLMRSLNVPSTYLPHAIDPSQYKPIVVDELRKKQIVGPHFDKDFILFWNNRNARRKQTGDVMFAFSKFMERVGKKNVALMMHTAPNDPEGQDMFALADEFGIDNNLIISDQRIDPETLNEIYNCCDCTMNIASAEGFGLSTLESLMAGVPIIAHFTGGLQFQIGDWWCDRDPSDAMFSDQSKMTSYAKKMFGSGVGKWWGIPVFPASRSCTGSQQIPFIFDDRTCHEDVIDALVSMHDKGKQKRREIGLAASSWAREMFSFEKLVSGWKKIIDDATSRPSTRKNYVCVHV